MLPLADWQAKKQKVDEFERRNLRQKGGEQQLPVSP